MGVPEELSMICLEFQIPPDARCQVFLRLLASVLWPGSQSILA